VIDQRNNNLVGVGNQAIIVKPGDVVFRNGRSWIVSPIRVDVETNVIQVPTIGCTGEFVNDGFVVVEGTLYIVVIPGTVP